MAEGFCGMMRGQEMQAAHEEEQELGSLGGFRAVG